MIIFYGLVRSLPLEFTIKRSVRVQGKNGTFLFYSYHLRAKIIFHQIVFAQAKILCKWTWRLDMEKLRFLKSLCLCIDILWDNCSSWSNTMRIRVSFKDNKYIFKKYFTSGKLISFYHFNCTLPTFKFVITSYIYFQRS